MSEPPLPAGWPTLEMCALLIAQNTPGKAGRVGFVLRMGALDTGSDSCLLQNSPIVQHPLPRHHAPPHARSAAQPGDEDGKARPRA